MNEIAAKRTQTRNPNRRILLQYFLDFETFPNTVRMGDLADIAGYSKHKSGYSNGTYLAMREFKQCGVLSYDSYHDCIYNLTSVDKDAILQKLGMTRFSESLKTFRGVEEREKEEAALVERAVALPRLEELKTIEEVKEAELLLYIEGHAQLIRGKRVMLDRDLAKVYGVDTKRLNQQRERNPENFPEDFAFQLLPSELDNLRLQNETSSSHGGVRYNPWAYTLEGCNMAATVLNTPKAVERAVKIIRTFSDLERMAHGEKPKQPGFAETLTAIASGFKTFRGEIDQMVLQKADKAEVDTIRKTLVETKNALGEAQKKVQTYKVEMDNLRFQQERHQQLDKDKKVLSNHILLGTRLRTGDIDDRRPEWIMWGSLVSTLNGGHSVSYEKLSLAEIELGLHAAKIVVAKRAMEYPEGVRDIEQNYPRFAPMLYEAIRVINQLELKY